MTNILEKFHSQMAYTRVGEEKTSKRHMGC